MPHSPITSAGAPGPAIFLVLPARTRKDGVLHRFAMVFPGGPNGRSTVRRRLRGALIPSLEAF
jgi:hypothetical protein